jgi:flagellar hook protein FlgE
MTQAQPAKEGGDMDVAMTAAISGISTAMSQLGTTAGNIANAQTPGYQRVSPTGPAAVAAPAPASSQPASNNVDLATELPDQMLAALMVKANMAVLRTAVDTYRSVLDATSR